MIFCDVWRVDWKSMVRPLFLAIGLKHHLLKIKKRTSRKSVFTHVTSIYANVLEQKKSFT